MSATKKMFDHGGKLAETFADVECAKNLLSRIEQRLHQSFVA